MFISVHILYNNNLQSYNILFTIHHSFMTINKSTRRWCTVQMCSLFWHFRKCRLCSFREMAAIRCRCGNKVCCDIWEQNAPGRGVCNFVFTL